MSTSTPTEVMVAFDTLIQQPPVTIGRLIWLVGPLLVGIAVTSGMMLGRLATA